MLITKANSKEYKIWTALAVILILLFFSGWFLSKADLQHELKMASQESKDSFKLISILVKEKLQKRNYKETQNFIVNWGEKSSEIVEINLSTKNGFQLAYYKAPIITSHKIIETDKLTYSYTGLANLTIHRSIDNIYLNHKRIVYQYLVGYFLIAIILYLLVYFNLHTYMQKQQLIVESQQRNEALLALKKSESKYRKLIDNLENYYFFYSHDTKGVFSYVSSSITKILGYTQDEFLSHFDSYLTNERINKKVDSFTTKSLAGKQQLPYKISIYHKDCSIRYLEVTETPLFDKDHKVIGVEGIARDITDKYHIAQEKKEQQRLLQSVMNGISDAVMVINSDYSVSMMNSSAQNIMNKSLILDVNSPKCYEISHHRSSPCTGKQHPCPLNLVLENKTSTSVIHEHIIGDKIRQVELSASPLKDENGKVYAIVESIHDISSLLQTQNELNES